MMQEKTINFNVIKAIAKVSEKLKDSKLKVKKSEEFTESVEKLNEYFGITEQQTWMLCAIISYCFDDDEDNCTLRDLARFIRCSVTSIMVYQDDFNTLLNKHYIINNTGLNKHNIGTNNHFEVNADLMNCIMGNKPVSVKYEDCILTIYDFFRHFGQCFETHRLFRERRRSEILSKFQDTEEYFSDLDFVKQSVMIIPDDKLRIFFYMVCADFLSREDSVLLRNIKTIYGESKLLALATEFMNENNSLFTDNLIEFTQKETIKDATLTLTYKAKEMLLGENVKLYTDAIRGADIINPDSIIHKDMFYSDENEHQMMRLKDIVSEDTFVQIQNRLTEKGMNKGVAVLLYGAPGTGKTESAFQIAKATGRKILRVDISSSKSCWFGESEKIIKRIFTDYRDLCKMCRRSGDTRIPILLFNEADGILSKRKDTSSSNVAQTENAMQNIILEEMEKFEGIMIATTNLADNLDAAFERRFLFKVKFDNPSIEAKKKIWKNKLSWLDDKSLETIAGAYDFSGGQIDNIARKVEMDEIITGRHADYNELIELCVNEKLGEKKFKIGF